MPRFRLATCAIVVALAVLLACRRDPSTGTVSPTGEFGGAGAGFSVQCSGWFPDWISPNPPPAAVESFQLAQGYPLGTPVFETVNGQVQVTGWNPPSPATTVAAAPWLAYDFHVPAQRIGYLNALKDYVMHGMDVVGFNAQKNTLRRWYHVPMMTTSPSSRREPYRGTTKERSLLAAAHNWIVSGNELQSFAIGYYNSLGGYTIGQVFKDPDPALSDPAKAQFINGALVFKVIFAEYDPAKIVSALNPLDGAPEWEVQDVEAPATLKKVRLLQLDVAVKDPRATPAGWVFATYVYDKSLTAITVPWRRLTPVGLQWGNDPDVTGAGVGTLDQTWTNTAALPAVFQNKLGRDGRLNGPVDNPLSSCLSCHSTAQARVGPTVGVEPLTAFRGVRLVPPGACSNAEDMTWFRNISSGTPFGVMTSNGGGCALAAPQPATPPLHSLDYSLQLADGLESSLYYRNPNPCMEMALELRSAAARSAGGRAGASGVAELRATARQVRRVPFTPEAVRRLNAEDKDRQKR